MQYQEQLELMKLWQQKLQQFLTDPQVVETLVQNTELMQDFWRQVEKTGGAYEAKHNHAEDVDDRFDASGEIIRLGQRVTILEKQVRELSTR